ncbi:MAG: hypothetical protein AAFZ65_12060 [Planctomycetota bacterium]
MKAALTLLAAALLPVAVDGLSVEDNPENVVASRLEGSWTLDAALTESLTGKPTKDGSSTLTFRPDPGVAGDIPEAFADFLEEPIWLAGQLEQSSGARGVLRGDPMPFLLTTLNGNPHVIAFRESGGDPFGDAESFNLTLVPALLPENDLLFVGGDFNNQPFDAFRRTRTQR